MSDLERVAEELERRGITPLSRVEWSYRHHLNSRSGVSRRKTGTYYGLIDHRPGYAGKQMASVLFVGNRWETRVPAEELRLLAR